MELYIYVCNIHTLWFRPYVTSDIFDHTSFLPCPNTFSAGGGGLAPLRYFEPCALCGAGVVLGCEVPWMQRAADIHTCLGCGV